MLIVCVVSVIEFVCVEDGDEVVVVCAKTRIDVSSAKQCVCETCARCVGSTVRPLHPKPVFDGPRGER